MTGTSYKVIFDLAQQGYPWWNYSLLFLFTTLGSIFCIVLRRRYNSGFLKVFTALWIGMALLIGGITLLVSVGNYNAAQAALQQPGAHVVEGPVENFHPMPIGGHGRESFTAADHSFELSTNATSIGFNKDSRHGGPIRAGMYVRITYAKLFGDPLDPTILRLEIRQ